MQTVDVLSDHLNKDMVTIRSLSMQKDIETVKPYQVTCGRLKKSVMNALIN